jgi:hypothetical protein
MENFGTLAKYYGSFLSYDLVKMYFSVRNKSINTIDGHINAAIKWVCNAQDAFSDGGVARSYSVIYHPFFRRKGWIPSYPETTGYLIPTLFDFARVVGRNEIVDRAVRMADWECRVQMENGAVQGGTIDQPATPAIFNTGQVIFGWIRTFIETEKPVYLDCAVKAGNFLVG